MRSLLLVPSLVLLALKFFVFVHCCQSDDKMIRSKFDGTYSGALRGYPTMESNQRRWMLLVKSTPTGKKDNRTKLKFEGTGHPSILEPGFAVELTGVFDAKGNATEPIREITWFIPNHETRWGATPLNEFSMPEEGRKEKNEARQVLVVGKLLKFRGGAFRVDIGNGRVEGKLAEDAKVNIRLTNSPLVFQLAMPGDRIEASGMYRESELRFAITNLHATEINVYSDRIIGDEKKIAKAKIPDKVKETETETETVVEDDTTETDKPADTSDNQTEKTESKLRILKIN